MDRAQFFESMIGSRVYRTKNGCRCAACLSVYTDGLIVKNAEHAGYLQEIEATYQIEGQNVKYFSTAQERDQHEL